MKMEYAGDLLQSQIIKQCRINMPEGLRELMADISREVLRTQPLNIEEFIANYISALLVTRDNLTIASQICTHVCDCDYQAELLKQLQDLDLDENNVEIAYDIIIKYLSKEKVDEGTLIAAIMNKTDIEPSVCPAVLQAVRTAYLRQQASKYTKYETSSGSEEDEIAKAASHTLNLYRETRPPDKMYRAMADKLNTSYRAYGVRRDIKSKNVDTPEKLNTLNHIQAVDDETVSTDSSLAESQAPAKKKLMNASVHQTLMTDPMRLNLIYLLKDNPRFPLLPSELYHQNNSPLEVTTSMQKNRITTVSSLSLAGSLSCLLKHKPYNTHDIVYLSELEEIPEKEHGHIDYTAIKLHLTPFTETKISPKAVNKAITFKNEFKDESYVETTVSRYNTNGQNESDNNAEELNEYVATINESD